MGKSITNDAFPRAYSPKYINRSYNSTTTNNSIIKEINPEYSLERLMLKLKLQYLSHMMQIADSLGKTLMPGKIEGRRRRRFDGWMASLTQWT